MANDTAQRGVDKHTEVPTFAPSDPTDGRAPVEWQSKYPKHARRQVWLESGYLGALLFLSPLLIGIIYSGTPNDWLKMDVHHYQRASIYVAAWLSGTLGGTLFAMKWLYHVFAKTLWHEDRRLWRLFTPHISGGLAFVLTCLIGSGMFRIFDKTALESFSAVVGTGFLVGYFSDSAVGKLSEIAQTVFGVSRSKEIHDGKASHPPRADKGDHRYV